MIEIWKDIKGYEGLYQVSNLGRVKSLPKNRNSLEKGEMFLKPYINKKGYFHVRLYKNTLSHDFLVHRLVGTHFIPNPDNKLQINHLINDKSNNRCSNLEWCTGTENVRHAWATGINTPRKGVLNGMAKLNDEKVILIKEQYKAGGTTYRKLAKEYSVDYALIQRIMAGRSWVHVK